MLGLDGQCFSSQYANDISHTLTFFKRYISFILRNYWILKIVLLWEEFDSWFYLNKTVDPSVNVGDYEIGIPATVSDYNWLDI